MSRVGARAPPPSAVAYTLTAGNGTLIQGKYSPPTPGQISGATYDPVDNQVFIGDSGGFAVYGVNGTSGRFSQAISTGAGDPISLVFLKHPNRLVTADGASNEISVVDPTNGTLLERIHLRGSPTSLAYDAANNTLYVAEILDSYNGSLVAFNASTYGLTATIAVGAYPDAIAFDPKDNLLYVANYVYSSVSVINTSTNQFLVHQIGVGTGQPYCLTYDPRNGYMYVGNQISGNVSILNASTRGFVGPGVKVSGDCLAMLYDPSNGNVYVGNAGAGIAAINGTSLNSSGGIVDPNTPEGLAFDSKDNLVFAANYGTNTITAFNASTAVLTIANEALSNTFLRATYDPANGDTYIATPDPGFICATPGSLTVIHSSPIPRIIGSIPVGYGPEATVLDPKSGYLFVANFCSNNVTIINTTTQSTVGPGVRVGSEPIALGYDPIHDSIIVANGGSHNVTFLNGSTGTIVAANVTVGAEPDSIAVDPTNDWIYVADYGSDKLSVLNGSTHALAHTAIPVGGCPEGVVYDPKGGQIISINSCSDNLTIVRGSTGGYVNSSVPAGVGPVDAALDAARNLLYVADAAGGTVAVVNLTTLAIQGSKIPVNSDPQGIVYLPETDQVEISDFLAGTISIIATAPVFSSFQAYPATVAQGRPTQLVVTAIEPGNPPLTVKYSGLPAGCLTENTSTLSCTPSAAGTFRIEVIGTDPRGFFGWATLTLVVLPRLGNASLNLSPNQIDLGDSVNLTTTLEGGMGNDSYAYSGLPAGCLSSNSSALSCTPSGTGWFTVLVTVTDPSGATNFAAAGLVVAPRPVILDFTATPLSTFLGDSTQLSVHVAGGTAPLSFTYHGLPTGCLTANMSEFECAPTRIGSFEIVVTVTDARAVTVSATALLDVAALKPPALSLLAFFASPSPVRVGDNATLTTVVSGGSGNDSFVYSGLPTGCLASNSSRVVCRPSAPGTYDIRVRATDSSGQTANGSTTLVSVPGASPPGATPVSSAPWWVLAGVAAVSAALGGIGGVLLARRIRARSLPDR